MAISATITDNLFYKTVHNGKGTEAEKAGSIVDVFNATAEADRAPLYADYNAFCDYLASERAKLDEIYAAVMQGNPFPAKNEISQTLAKADDLPDNILQKIQEVSQQYTSKSLQLQFTLHKNQGLQAAYKILSAVEMTLPVTFWGTEASENRKTIERLETQANNINMTGVPIPVQLEGLKKMTTLAMDRLARQKEKEAQRALKEYLDSDRAFRVGRELQAPERAQFKRRTPTKAL